MDNNYLKYLFQEDLYLVNNQTENTNPTKKEVKKDTTETDKSTPPKVQFKSEGDATSAVCIINKSLHDEIISNENRDFLEKVLAAVNLKLSEIYLLQFDADSFESLSNQVQSTTLITFGCQNSELYTIKDANNKRVLHAQSLDQISQDTTSKRNLWNGLKELFQQV